MTTILIVDDQPTNLQTLLFGLSDMGYTLQTTRDGTTALTLAQQINPKLILLDIMMPGLNGFEVCKQLKMIPETKDIPVIFLTALHDPIDKVRGFEAGGEDYITKPFSIEEVRARVKLHIALYEKQQQLELLRQQDQLRTIRLNAFRNQILDQLQHDVRSPLTTINNSLYLMVRSINSDNPKVKDYTQRANRAVDEVVSMMNSLLDTARQEIDQPPRIEPVNVLAFVEEIVAQFRSSAEIKRISLGVGVQTLEPIGQAFFDPEQMVSVIKNLLSNAIKYTGNGGAVFVQIGFEREKLLICVKDTGCGIAEEHLESIFQRFYRIMESAGSVEGTGLGLYIAKMITEQHGGTLKVKSKLGKGSIFTVAIPQEQYSRV